MINAIHISCAALIVTLLAGCGKSPTGNEPPAPKKGSITVTVKEYPSKGLPGFEIATLPATITATTDSMGNARLEDITPGQYGIFARKDGYHGFTKTIVATPEDKYIAFTYFPEVDASVRDDTGKPCAGAVITTDPSYGEWTTDAEGAAVFHDMPEMQYRFIIHRDRYADTIITAYLAPRIEFTVPTGLPDMHITRPVMNAEFISDHGIRFIGEGNDFEDGRLSGDSLAWYSDLNGLLGHGEEITVTSLDKGIHTISLVGTDSDGKKGSASLSIILFTYKLDTFYPTPDGESWKYRYITPEFYITTEEGSREYWIMKEMTVKFESEDERKVILLYDVARDGRIVHCSYSVSDYLSIKDGSVYVVRTAEAIKEWDSSISYFEMYINTSYAPKLLILKNIDDLSAERSYSAKSDISVSWVYAYYGKTSMIFQEWRPVFNEFEVGDEEIVDTDRGPVHAHVVTMRERDGFERTWHLSRGLGIVRITDNAFAPESVAVLKDASILRFNDPDNGMAKPAVLGPARQTPTLDFRINRKTGENMRKLARYLGSIGPR